MGHFAIRGVASGAKTLETTVYIFLGKQIILTKANLEKLIKFKKLKQITVVSYAILEYIIIFL